MNLGQEVEFASTSLSVALLWTFAGQQTTAVHDHIAVPSRGVQAPGEQVVTRPEVQTSCT